MRESAAPAWRPCGQQKPALDPLTFPWWAVCHKGPGLCRGKGLPCWNLPSHWALPASPASDGRGVLGRATQLGRAN